MQINAFQRAADVVVQKSLREGFGLTVSEGLWKGRPVIGGRCGGIVLQIRDGVDGYLVDSVDECASARSSCSRTRRRPTRWAPPAGARARNFLSTRELEDYLRTSSPSSGPRDRRLAPGPVQLHPGADGSLSRRRGAGGVVSALAPLLTRRNPAPGSPPRSATGDRVAAAAGQRRSSTGSRSQLLAPDPTLHRLHYDLVSNATLWFLYHGLFDLPRRPRFDAGSARRGAPTGRSTGSSPTPSASSRATARSCWCRTTSSPWCRPWSGAPARPPRGAVHAHPVLRPEVVRVLPEYAAHELLGAMARCPADSTRRDGPTPTRPPHARSSGRIIRSHRRFTPRLGPDVDMLHERRPRPKRSPRHGASTPWSATVA